MAKIPVKIVQTEDIHGTKKVGVMLDVAYYIESNSESNLDEKVKQFKQLYFEILEKAKKYIPQKGGKHKTTDFWKLSKLLLDLKKSTSNQFEITNFRNALQRDFLFTGRYIDKILEFALYYNKNEISDLISISYYVELSQKKQKLDKIGFFDKEKKHLLKMSQQGTLPGVMEYRKYLQNLLMKHNVK